MRQREDKMVSVDKKTGRVRVQTINKEPSKTQQQFKDECDINNIMKKYETTGEFLNVTRKQGIYADFSKLTDYQGMLQKVLDADAAFAALPALTRKRFNNNPAELISFLQDEKNNAEGIALGLINKPETAAIKNDLNDNEAAIEPGKKKEPK